MPATTYLAFGLHISSEQPLPELAESPRQGPPDVDVRWSAVPEELEQARVRHPMVQVRDDDILVTIRGVARFLLHAGTEISVAPFAGAASEDVRAYLLGTMFGLICHQRDLLPLHANAIVVDGRAFAFAGRSGAGKSTLAAYFQRTGYKLLTDDVCVLSFPQTGAPLAWPGIPRIRLWKDSIHALDEPMTDTAPVIGRLEKYILPCARFSSEQGLPLQRVYILDLEDRGHSDAITLLKGAEALAAIRAQTFRKEFLGMLDAAGRCFLRNAALLASVSVFRVPWRHDYRQLAGEAQRLEQHIREASFERP